GHHLAGWLVRTEAGYAIEVVSRPPGFEGFVKLPRRWVVERTFAWRGRYRRNSRDYERFAESSEAMIKVSSIHRMLRLLKPDKSKGQVPFKYRELGEKVTGSPATPLTRYSHPGRAAARTAPAEGPGLRTRFDSIAHL
ncbi:MAG TPA: transposase, partial [Isosphaeraceae bacterium]|nr:transposase [Isosphaeraceae bacterium]